MATHRARCVLPRLAALLALAALGALAACNDPPRTCANLAGTWRADADEQRRYHVGDAGGKKLEMYAIFDDAQPKDGPIVWAPAVFDLERRGGELSGTETRRGYRAGKTCVFTRVATIARCDGASMTLVLPDVDAAAADWESCTRPPSGGTTELVLWRE